MTGQDVSLAYLDDFHAGDALFVQSLSRSLARLKERRVVLVHGSGEQAEHALEAEGIFRERERGLLRLETAREHALVEGALRHANRKITGALTDAVVPAVGIIGSARGLLRVKDGRVVADNVAWLESLIHQGVVPILAAFAVDDETGRTGEVPIHMAIEALSDSLHATCHVIVFTKTNLPGILNEGSPEPFVSFDRLDDRIHSNVEAVADLAAGRISVLLTNTTGFASAGGPIGTRIRNAT